MSTVSDALKKRRRKSVIISRTFLVCFRALNRQYNFGRNKSSGAAFGDWVCGMAVSLYDYQHNKPCTKLSIARMTGLTRQTVDRCVVRLERYGLLQKERRGYRIKPGFFEEHLYDDHVRRIANAICAAAKQLKKK